MTRSILRRAVFAAGAAAGLATASHAQPAPLFAAPACDGGPEAWALVCMERSRAIAETGAIASLRGAPLKRDVDLQADLSADEARAAEAAYACASAELWDDALLHADQLAGLAAERVVRTGSAERQDIPEPICADPVAGAELDAFHAYIDLQRRAAARAALGEIRSAPVLSLPGSVARLEQGADEARCAWLAEAAFRRAQHGVRALAFDDASEGILKLASALSAYDEALPACRAVDMAGPDALGVAERRTAVSHLLMVSMRDVEAASREASEIRSALFDEGLRRLPELVRPETVAEQPELLVESRADDLDVAAHQPLGGADGGGGLQGEGLAAPERLVTQTGLREDPGDQTALGGLLRADRLP